MFWVLTNLHFTASDLSFEWYRFEDCTVLLGSVSRSTLAVHRGMIWCNFSPLPLVVSLQLSDFCTVYIACHLMYVFVSHCAWYRLRVWRYCHVVMSCCPCIISAEHQRAGSSVRLGFQSVCWYWWWEVCVGWPTYFDSYDWTLVCNLISRCKC